MRSDVIQRTHDAKRALRDPSLTCGKCNGTLWGAPVKVATTTWTAWSAVVVGAGRGLGGEGVWEAHLER